MAWKPDYITSAQLKNYVRVADTVDDDEVADAVSTASRAVDNYTHRQFGQVDTAEARTYTASYDRHRCVYVAQIDDLQDVTGLTVVDSNGDTVTSSNYTLEPVNALFEGKVYTRILLPTCGNYVLTGLWGWSSVVTAVKLATKLQGSRFLSRRDSPYGIAGSPDSGSEMRLLARLDPDVGVALSEYVRRWWVR